MSAYKVLLLCFLCILAITCNNPTNQEARTETNEKPFQEVNYTYDTLVIACDNICYQATSKVAYEFMSKYKNIVVQVLPSDTAFFMLKNNQVHFAITSYQASELQATAIPVAADILTLIVNFHNPYIQHLATHGISIDALSKIAKGKSNNWKQIYNSLDATPLKFYLFPYNSGGFQSFCKLLNISAKEVKILPELKEKHIFQNIKNIQTAIGFCSHLDAYDPFTKFRNSEIYIVGIDADNSGFLTNEELYWDDLDMLYNAYKKKNLLPLLVRIYYLYQTQSVISDEFSKHFVQYATKHASTIFEQHGFFNPQK